MYRFDWKNIGRSAGIFVLMLPLIGCAPTIKGLSEEAFRHSAFNESKLSHGGMALFPVIMLDQQDGSLHGLQNVKSAPYTPSVYTGKDVRRDDPPNQEANQVIIGELLLTQIQTRRPALELLTPGEVLKRVNDAEIYDKPGHFVRSLPATGFTSKKLRALGEALGSRYLFVSQAAVQEETSSASITLIWTIGRKSELRSVKIHGQIWDTEAGRQVWSGAGVGYSRLRLFEGTPLVEEMALQAVDELLATLMSK